MHITRKEVERYVAGIIGVLVPILARVDAGTSWSVVAPTVAGVVVTYILGSFLSEGQAATIGNAVATEVTHITHPTVDAVAQRTG
jgi:VIT1/CCC1 family predicted Fe2+/Mn2+ transporter